MVLAMFENVPNNTNLTEVTQPENINLLWAIKRLKNKFDDQSIAEVYYLYKKLVTTSPSNTHLPPSPPLCRL